MHLLAVSINIGLLSAVICAEALREAVIVKTERNWKIVFILYYGRFAIAPGANLSHSAATDMGSGGAST